MAAVLVVLVAPARAQDLVDPQWRTNPDGTLWMQDPYGLRDDRDQWIAMFPGLLSADPERDDTARIAADLGPLALLPLLLTGDGGAAANCAADLRRRRLNFRVHFALDGFEPDRDPLRDLLRVDHLAAHGLLGGAHALRRFTLPHHDPFVRAAAARALRDFHPEVAADWTAPGALPTRVTTAAVRRGLDRLPARFDLLIEVDAVGAPSVAPLLDAWRRWGQRRGSEIVLAHGASTSPAILVDIQRRFDGLGQIAYELAARFGNWRIDHAMIALQCGEPDRFWFHAGGVFQTQRIANGLAQAGFDVRRTEAGEITATVLGWHLRASPDALECWQDTYDCRDRGGAAPSLAARHAAPHVARAFAPEGSALLLRTGFPCRSARVVARTGPAVLAATVTCVDEEGARELRRRFAAWRRTGLAAPEDHVHREKGLRWRDLDALLPGAFESERAVWAFVRWLREVRCEQQGTEVTYTFDASALSAYEALRLWAGAELWLRDEDR